VAKVHTGVGNEWLAVRLEMSPNRSVSRLIRQGSDNKKPTMIKVPPTRIPEEPGAVIPHARICERGVGQLKSLPYSKMPPEH